MSRLCCLVSVAIPVTLLLIALIIVIVILAAKSAEKVTGAEPILLGSADLLASTPFESPTGAIKIGMLTDVHMNLRYNSLIDPTPGNPLPFEH